MKKSVSVTNHNTHFKDGKKLDHYPSGIFQFDGLSVEYITMPGWKTSIANCRSYDELPVNCKNYILKAQELLGESFINILNTVTLLNIFRPAFQVGGGWTLPWRHDSETWRLKRLWMIWPNRSQILGFKYLACRRCSWALWNYMKIFPMFGSVIIDSIIFQQNDLIFLNWNLNPHIAIFIELFLWCDYCQQFENLMLLVQTYIWVSFPRTGEMATFENSPSWCSAAGSSKIVMIIIGFN